jgi:hypothetical protein
MSQKDSEVSKPTSRNVSGAVRTEIGTLVRMVLALALAFTLVVALRWAVGVTNANARQISTNLINMRNRYGQDVPGGPSAPVVLDPVGKKQKASKPTPGPSIDPIETAPGR